jgi:purine-binding chemotaxis protein CheW
MSKRIEELNMENDLLDENEAGEPLVRWVTFELGQEVYGVLVKKVREILRINNISPVPGAPDYIVGITNIRGSVVSVIDGRKRINLSPTENTDLSRMIVMESEEDIVAVVVDKVSDIIDLPESSVVSNPKISASDGSKYISGVISHSDGLIIILDSEKFITDEQYDMVSGF